MRSSRTEAFIEEILADRPPGSFNASSSDADVLRVAITLRAGRPDPVEPDDGFVEGLRRELAAAASQPGGPLSSIAAGPHRSSRPAAASPSSWPLQRRRASRRSGVLGKVAAAVLLVGATIGTTSALEGTSPAPASRTAAPNNAVRSGELLAADGRVLGQMYAYKGASSWLFLIVHARDLAGVYTCEVQLANATTVRVGTVVLENGSGVYAHVVRIDVDQLRAAKLVAPDGSTLATARLS